MKALRCRLRRHKWKTVIEHGEEFRVCEECGTQTGGGGGKPPMSSNDLSWMKGDPGL